jgi:hypothetical protein
MGDVKQPVACARVHPKRHPSLLPTTTETKVEWRCVRGSVLMRLPPPAQELPMTRSPRQEGRT